MDIVSEMKSEINSLRDTINNLPKERSSVIGEIKKLSSEVTASNGSLLQKVDYPKISFAKFASIKSKNIYQNKSPMLKELNGDTKSSYLCVV